MHVFRIQTALSVLFSLQKNNQFFLSSLRDGRREGERERGGGGGVRERGGEREREREF